MFVLGLLLFVRTQPAARLYLARSTAFNRKRIRLTLRLRAWLGVGAPVAS